MKCPNCNETEHEPTAKFCHVCGRKLDPLRREFIEQGLRITGDLERKIRDAQNDADDYYVPKWIKILRWSLLFIIFVWYVVISPEESKFDLPGAPWGGVTAVFVNGFTFLCTLCLCHFANIGHFDNQKRRWKMYHEWIHFAVAAFIPCIGYLISTIQNGWVILLDCILVGIIILISFNDFD